MNVDMFVGYIIYSILVLFIIVLAAGIMYALFLAVQSWEKQRAQEKATEGSGTELEELVKQSEELRDAMIELGDYFSDFEKAFQEFHDACMKCDGIKRSGEDEGIGQ